MVMVQWQYGMDFTCSKRLQSQEGKRRKEKQADKPIRACDATTNQGNQNVQAVMATLAQMATQEEWWFCSAWIFLILMAKAPEFYQIVASAVLQMIIFFFIYLAFSSQASHFLILHHTLKQPLWNRFFKSTHNKIVHHKHKCNNKGDHLVPQVSWWQCKEYPPLPSYSLGRLIVVSIFGIKN